MISREELPKIQKALLRDAEKQGLKNIVDYASNMFVTADRFKKQCILYYDRVKDQVFLSVGNEALPDAQNIIILWIIPSDWKDSYMYKIPMETVIGVSEDEINENIEDYVHDHTLFTNYAEALAEYLLEHDELNQVQKILDGRKDEDLQETLIFKYAYDNDELEIA